MGKLTATHTYATLEVSEEAWQEIAKLLREAKYDHVFCGLKGEEIDMHGIALVSVKRNAERG